MNGLAFIFLLLNAVAITMLPRRWALLPLLMGACYMTNAQNLTVGPFHFTVLRLLLLLGFVRAMARKERLPGGLKGLDWIMLIWGAWLLCSSMFHNPFTDALVFRMGAVYNALGLYFLIRVFCQTEEDLIQLCKTTAFVLVPVALEMSFEKFSGHNLFSFFGGVPEMPQLREGTFRAQGPFGHSILAGTVGAMCAPLMIGIWRNHTRVAKIGFIACLAMVIASKSSGPLMSLMVGAFALGWWRWRHLTRQLKIASVVGYITIDLIAPRPAYYAVLCHVDLTGSSTGWHRAELIHQAYAHLGEWWFAGTDYTRHWMPYGVSTSPDQCDITNQYLFYGVWGGLPLMFLFIGALWTTFRYIGQVLRLRNEDSFENQFLKWSLGAGLFSWTVTFISVAFFDQSMMFFFLYLAAIGSMHASALAQLHETAVAETEREDNTGFSSRDAGLYA
jgi:hypothetical protein